MIRVKAKAELRSPTLLTNTDRTEELTGIRSRTEFLKAALDVLIAREAAHRLGQTDV